MPKLGLSSTLSRSGGMITPGIITDNLVMKHMYPAGAVQPLSDGATYFNGSNSEVNFNSHSSLDVGVNNFTATCWFNPSTITASGHIMGKGTGLSGAPYDGRGWACTIYGGNSKIYFDIYGGTDGSATEDVRLNVIIPSALPSANRWYHLAVTRTTSGTKSLYTIYIDGVLEVQSEATDGGTYDAISAGEAINDAGNDFTIGESASSTNDFKGYICNVGYWLGRGLTQAQIKSIMFKQYADLSTSEKTNLVSFWNLDTLTNDSLNHYSGISEKNLVLDEHNTYSSNLLSLSEQTGDSNWTTLYGDSATVITGPTTENYKSSPSSIKWVPATGDDGVRSSNFTTTAGQIYEISFWAYTTNSGNSSIRAKLEKGTGSSAASDDDDGSASTDINFTVPSANQWHQYIGYITQETSGSTSKVIITSGGQSSGDYYIDDISIREVTNAGRLV